MPKDHTRAWAEFYDSARYNQTFDERTTLFLHLAAAMAVGCDP